MNSTLKQYVSLFVPPIVMRLTRRMPRADSAVVVRRSSTPPASQDLDLYWDVEFADELEEWGRNTVWIEVALLFSTLKGKVLDIACGTGQTMAILNRNRNLEVHGFDISDRLIKRALDKGIPESRVRVADATVRSYAENEFDYSFSIGSIEHFTEKGIHQFLKNAAYYTKEYSFHMLPANGEALDKGWETTRQSYFNNSVGWWTSIFTQYFSEVTVLDSTWAGLDQKGKWFICRK